MKACHEHGYTTQDGDGDSECCICARNPCDFVNPDGLIAHLIEDASRTVAAMAREVAYVTAHGHLEESPW